MGFVREEKHKLKIYILYIVQIKNSDDKKTVSHILLPVSIKEMRVRSSAVIFISKTFQHFQCDKIFKKRARRVPKKIMPSYFLLWTTLDSTYSCLDMSKYDFLFFLAYVSLKLGRYRSMRKKESKRTHSVENVRLYAVYV